MMLSAFLAAAAATAPVPAMTVDWWSPVYDTPRRGLAPGELSFVVAEITVTKHGGFGGCVGRVFSGNPQMGPYVCARLKDRAVFEPARGPDRRKVIGIYRKVIALANVKDEASFRVPNFGIRIPAFEVASSTASPFEIQFYLDSNGQVSNCSLIEAVGINLERRKQIVDQRTVERACAEISVQMKPVPPRDKGGIQIPTVQNALVVVGSRADPRN